MSAGRLEPVGSLNVILSQEPVAPHYYCVRVSRQETGDSVPVGRWSYEPTAHEHYEATVRALRFAAEVHAEEKAEALRLQAERGGLRK